MIWLYRLLFLPALVCSLPYYAWRMLRRGGYRHDFHHRFGLIDRPPPKPPGTKRLWIQAVSVGEAQALAPLLAHLSQSSAREIVLTTTTSTGYHIVREKYARSVLKTGIFPIDFWPFARSAWRRLDPDLAILMEGELWPEHLHQACLHRVPVALINARISDRSFSRYSRFPRVSRYLFSQLALILTSSPSDHERFLALGADPARTHYTGSLKADLPAPPALTAEQRIALREELGFFPAAPQLAKSSFPSSTSTLHPSNTSTPLVLLGSSTWPGEEQLLLDTFHAALALGLDARLLLVPRHAERRREIIALLEKQPLAWHLRSTAPRASQPVHIHLADTTGELLRLSQAADLAFVGKSLAPNYGGQTPIEAAALGLPLVYGPFMSNFKDIARALEDAHAARRALDAQSAQATLLALLQDPAERSRMSAAAKQWHAASQGATQRTAAGLEALLG